MGHPHSVGVAVGLDKVETEGSNCGVRRGGRGLVEGVPALAWVPSEMVTAGVWTLAEARWRFQVLDIWTPVPGKQL